jgi:hypothetical protein
MVDGLIAAGERLIGSQGLRAVVMSGVHERTTAEILLAESVEQDAIMPAANRAEAVAAKLERRKPAFIDP